MNISCCLQSYNISQSNTNIPVSLCSKNSLSITKKNAKYKGVSHNKVLKFLTGLLRQKLVSDPKNLKSHLHILSPVIACECISNLQG